MFSGNPTLNIADNTAASNSKVLAAKVKERNLQKLITYLRRWPTASVEKQAKHLEMSVENLRRTYYRELQQRKLAVINPVFTSKAENQYQRFWVFIETTYQGPQESDIIPDNYQVKVVDQITSRMNTYFCDDLVLNSIDIVLGSDWDIVLSIQAKEVEYMHLFVTEHVRTCPHVLRTSSAWAQPVNHIEAARTEAGYLKQQ